MTGPPPALTVDQMREVDRAMVHDFHIGLETMMENAGRVLSDLAHGRFRPRSAVVLAGPGGNGGGGLVAARHLSNRGVTVHVVLSRPAPDLAPVTARQLDMVQRMGLAVVDEPPPADLVIDALIGYSLRGDPSGTARELIGWTSSQPAPVLALDVPSGLDATSGHVGVPCVRAVATLTLALPKTGLERAPDVVGDLYLADISVPPVLYERMGIRTGAWFADGPLVELRARGVPAPRSWAPREPRAPEGPLSHSSGCRRGRRGVPSGVPGRPPHPGWSDDDEDRLRRLARQVEHETGRGCAG